MRGFPGLLGPGSCLGHGKAKCKMLLSLSPNPPLPREAQEVGSLGADEMWCVEWWV